MSEACSVCNQPKIGHPTFCETHHIPVSVVLRKLNELATKSCSCHSVLPKDRLCKHDQAKNAIMGVNIAIGELRTALD